MPGGHCTRPGGGHAMPGGNCARPGSCYERQLRQAGSRRSLEARVDYSSPEVGRRRGEEREEDKKYEEEVKEKRKRKRRRRLGRADELRLEHPILLPSCNNLVHKAGLLPHNARDRFDSTLGLCSLLQYDSKDIKTGSFQGYLTFRRDRGAYETHMDPSYACLFVGYMEHTLFCCYTGTIPQLFFCYIDNRVADASRSHVELEQFVNFTNTFHLNLKFTWTISDISHLFLDLSVSIC
eukprot:g47921.t1